MSSNGIVTGLLNETSWQQMLDRQAAIAASTAEGGGRNVGGTMGKNDFLMLLAMQLRYQNPLEPASESDFAAQLAQFSSLEQMQNMNTTLLAMATNQAYSLVGKLVYAQQFQNGQIVEYYGVVESIFTKNGETFAQLEGYDFGFPVSSILEVIDSSNMLTSQLFIQTSNNLIGRTVVARVDDEDIEGVVTRIAVDGGNMVAYIDDGTDEQKIVNVGAIYDIRVT